MNTMIKYAKYLRLPLLFLLLSYLDIIWDLIVKIKTVHTIYAIDYHQWFDYFIKAVMAILLGILVQYIIDLKKKIDRRTTYLMWMSDYRTKIIYQDIDEMENRTGEYVIMTTNEKLELEKAHAKIFFLRQGFMKEPELDQWLDTIYGN